MTKNITTLLSVAGLIDDITTGMASKGLRTPGAQVWISSGGKVTIYATWKDETKPGGTASHFNHGADADSAANAIFEWIGGLPDIATMQREQFQKALALAVEIGQQFGFDQTADLQAMILKLSDNALTDQSAGAGGAA